jgi:hypothetical protein
MKSKDWVLLSVVGVSIYLAYRKLGSSRTPLTLPTSSSTPSLTALDAGVDQISWNTDSQRGFVDQLINQAVAL